MKTDTNLPDTFDRAVLTITCDDRENWWAAYEAHRAEFVHAIWALIARMGFNDEYFVIHRVVTEQTEYGMLTSCGYEMMPVDRDVEQVMFVNKTEEAFARLVTTVSLDYLNCPDTTIQFVVEAQPAFGNRGIKMVAHKPGQRPVDPRHTTHIIPLSCIQTFLHDAYGVDPKPFDLQRYRDADTFGALISIPGDSLFNDGDIPGDVIEQIVHDYLETVADLRRGVLIIPTHHADNEVFGFHRSFDFVRDFMATYTDNLPAMQTELDRLAAEYEDRFGYNAQNYGKNGRFVRDGLPDAVSEVRSFQTIADLRQRIDDLQARRSRMLAQMQATEDETEIVWPVIEEEQGAGKPAMRWFGSNHDAMLRWPSTVPFSKWQDCICDVCGNHWDDGPYCFVVRGDHPMIIWACCRCMFIVETMLIQLGVDYEKYTE